MMPNNSRYTEETGQYVNIHGKEVRVFLCENTGRILVPIDEVKEMGFRLYQKKQYSKLLIDDAQFNKEFDLYMLQSAQCYMLQQKIAFTESDILESIDKVKKVLSQSNTASAVKSNEKSLQESPNIPSRNLSRDSNPPSFMQQHTVKESSDSFMITTTLRQPTASTLQNVQNKSNVGGRNSLGQSNSVAKNSPDQSNSVARNSLEQSNSKPRNSFEQNNSTPRNSFEQTNSTPRNSFEQNKSTPRNSYDESNSRPRNSYDQNNSSPRNSSDQSSTGARNNIGFKPKREQNNLDSRRSPAVRNSNDSLATSDDVKLAQYELTQSQHTVIISYVYQNQYWVQDVENLDNLLEIDALIQKEISKESEHPPSLVYGKIYLGLDPDEQNWYRCKVIKFKPTLTVLFVDYGNTAQLTSNNQLREVPDELLKHPCQALRVTLTDLSEKPKLNDTVTLSIVKRYESGIYLVQTIKEASHNAKSPASQATSLSKPAVTSSPKPAAVATPKTAAVATPTFFTRPPPFCKLTNCQRVMIIGHVEGCVALRTKESYDVMKQIEFALKEDEMTAKAVDKVQRGQLVLYKKDGLQRAMVLNVQKNSVDIELLDYCEKIKVDLSDLKHINEDLSKQPVTYLMTPPIKGYSQAADDLLRDLGNKKTKATVVLSRGEVDLQLKDELLSAKLQPKCQNDRPMLQDFTPYAPPVGVAEYTLNIYSNIKNSYFGSLEALSEHLEIIMQTELEDNEAYAPIQGEVCLGYYQESWSRCVVVSVTDSYNVRFIDFGNEETLDKKELRKLPEECKAVPILAFQCQLTGYPRINNVEALLDERMKDGVEKSFNVNIKKFNGTSYEIEIPEIYNALT